MRRSQKGDLMLELKSPGRRADNFPSKAESRLVEGEGNFREAIEK